MNQAVELRVLPLAKVASRDADGDDLCRCHIHSGATLLFEARHAERAIYTVAGEIEIAGERFGPSQLLVLKPGMAATVRALGAARCMLLGGEPVDGPRHLWWNFVASSRERMEQAKADWAAGRFPAVPGETEFIPLP